MSDPPHGWDAGAALHEQFEILTQMSEEARVGILAGAADLLIRLGDRQAVAEVVKTGFQVADAIDKLEVAAEKLRSFPVGVSLRRRLTTG